MSERPGPPPRPRRPRPPKPPPPSPAPGGGWSARAVALALLIGAWLGRQASILPEQSEQIFDLAIAVGIAVLVALGYRRLARRYRGGRSRER